MVVDFVFKRDIYSSLQLLVSVYIICLYGILCYFEFLKKQRCKYQQSNSRAGPISVSFSCIDDFVLCNSFSCNPVGVGITMTVWIKLREQELVIL